MNLPAGGSTVVIAGQVFREPALRSGSPRHAADSRRGSFPLMWCRDSGVQSASPDRAEDDRQPCGDVDRSPVRG